MRILIELPSWLGDSVMTTPAIENLVIFFKNPDISLLGSVASIGVFRNHPNVTKLYISDKNYLNLYKTIREIGKVDIFISFRGSFRSKFAKFFVSSKSKYQFDKNVFNNGHQVEKYNNFLNHSFQINTKVSNLKVHVKNNNKIINKKKLLGISPGASYGSSKRWYPKEFAKVAIDLSNQYDIIILGGNEEKSMAEDIEEYLIKKGVYNYQNLVSKTSISDLISKIENLDLFITGDSGPMHLAAAFQVPTIAVFGPTNDKETSQWMNKKSVIVKKNLKCQPCMKRKCPLKHHNCMKKVKAKDVLVEVQKI
jgi:heptosyltransferase II